MKTVLCGIEMKNPLVLASGILGTSRALLNRAIENGAGAVTIKSISRQPREGHNNPTVIEFEGGIMNAVGYSNFGVEGALKEFVDLKGLNAPVFGSIIGNCVEDFERVMVALKDLEFSAIEIPLSCPHTPGFGTMARQDDPDNTYEITKAVRRITDKPLFVKLSHISRDLGEVAKAAERAGASGITAINTAGPGMVIDIGSGKPVMGFRIGGMSGPAIKPLAVRCVYDVYEAVKIPVIGVGGVTNGRDAIEMVMAGASCVGVGSAVHYRGMGVFGDIAKEMEGWMEENGCKSLKEIRGIAHE